jgi:hypothetical protein
VDATERWELLTTLVRALPPKISKAIVYVVIAEALAIYVAHTVVSPEWCKERDQALANVGRAIEKPRKVLLRTQLESADSALNPFSDAYDALHQHSFLTAAPDESGRRPERYVGGRPRSTWVQFAKTRLARLGVSRRRIDELLKAVHLVDDHTT